MKVSKDAEATFIPATVTRRVFLNGKSIYDLTDEYGEKQLKSTITMQPNESAQDAVARHLRVHRRVCLRPWPFRKLVEFTFHAERL